MRAGHLILALFVFAVGFLAWKGTGSIPKAVIAAIVLTAVTAGVLAILLH